jgi:hypothetical protein
MARTPSFTSGACARVISGQPPALAAAPVAATPFRNVRLLVIVQLLFVEVRFTSCR